MKRGMIGFHQSNTLISKSIRWFTDSEVSHSYIVRNESQVIEADPKGVIIRDFVHSPYRKEWLFELPNKHLIEYSMRITEARLNEDYGKLQILSAALIELQENWFGIEPRYSWAPFTAGVICSELQLENMQNRRFLPASEEDKDRVDPDINYRMCWEFGKLFSFSDYGQTQWEKK